MDRIEKTGKNVQAALNNKLLTPSEVAYLLGVTTGTLQVWRTTRRYPLEFVKIGSRVMYREAAVFEFIERRAVSCWPEG